MEQNLLNLNGLMHSYEVDKQSGLIDYNSVEKLAMENKPSYNAGEAYSRIIDFKKFREICDKVKLFFSRYGSFFWTSC